MNLSTLRRRSWLVLAVILATPLILTSFALQGDETSKSSPSPGIASLAGAKLIFRGPESAAANRRFTLEVLVVNEGATPLKDLELIGKFDANLEHSSKAAEYSETIGEIAADDLRIVRLAVKPRKFGPGGIDFVLRSKSGATQEVRFVMPVGTEDSAPAPVDAVDGSRLQLKIGALKECFADQPRIVLVTATNTDRKAMTEGIELVLTYGMMNPDSRLSAAPPILPKAEGSARDLAARIAPPLHQNVTHTKPISVPALEAGESFTVPVRITPSRIGDLGMAIAKRNSDKTLASVRLPVRFDPNQPIEKLLPAQAAPTVPTKLPTTLTEVPEVGLEAPHSKAMNPQEAFEHVAHLIEKINHANRSKTDAYVEALIQHRPDMNGLPFMMGASCRLAADRAQHFQGELSRLRVAMAHPATLAAHLPNPVSQPSPEVAIQARIAAMVQILEPTGHQMGKEMVKYLSALSHVDSTRALTKLAISADDDKVRTDALAALESRRDKDVNDVLLRGLQYPWPAVAQRSADAIVKLKRMDLASHLADMLDRPDPRMPRTIEKNGEKVHTVREMVRINHLRNCLLCHSPATAAKAGVSGEASFPPPANSAPPFNGKAGLIAMDAGLTAPVPLPNQAVPTPTPQGGYGRFSQPETLISIDITYLRQDFSVMLPVANAKPWPDSQRFDFVVRTRTLSEKDAEVYRQLFPTLAAGELTPYQRTAVTALRQLTGRDAAPNAAAWRAVLADLTKTSSN